MGSTRQAPPVLMPDVRSPSKDHPCRMAHPAAQLAYIDPDEPERRSWRSCCARTCCRRRGSRRRGCASCGLLATLLFGDAAAGLCEDASARLHEHPARLRLPNLAPGFKRSISAEAKPPRLPGLSSDHVEGRPVEPVSPGQTTGNRGLSLIPVVNPVDALVRETGIRARLQRWLSSRTHGHLLSKGSRVRGGSHMSTESDHVLADHIRRRLAVPHRDRLARIAT